MALEGPPADEVTARWSPRMDATTRAWFLITRRLFVPDCAGGAA
jgi:hypothetical protein